MIQILTFVASIILAYSIPCQNIDKQYIPKQYTNNSQILANKINITQQDKIINIYIQFGTKKQTIDQYTIEIQNERLYVNNIPYCNKKPTKLKNYNAKNDIWICFDQLYTLTCTSQWDIVFKCGTYLQIHKPFHPQIIQQIDLQQSLFINDNNGNMMTNMLAQKLCAGLYHLWLVYYTRNRKVIKMVKTIYISYPSCIC